MPIDKVEMSRRTALSAPAALVLAVSANACAAPDQAATGPGSRTLVAYFTRSGNTQVIAHPTPAFSMEADQERSTMTQVREWLGQIASA